MPSKKCANKIKKSWDYIVLGAGAAGSSLTRTLSDSGASVLLIEWGLDLRADPVVVNVSSEYGIYGPYRRTKNDFMQEVNTAGVFNSIVNFEAGKGGPGGSTCHYFGNATRGQQWDQWASILNDSRWSYDAVLPIMKEIENYHGTTQIPLQRGHSGPLDIYQNHPGSAQNDKLCQVMASTWNIPILDDYNGNIVNVSAEMQRLVQEVDGVPTFRVWGANFLPYSILDENGNGTNGRKLKALFESVADKLIFNDPANPNRATGVAIVSSKYGNHIFNAKKAIILTGGPYGPAILHRSGIGPISVLADIGVLPKYINENVGAHFKCHYGLCVPFDPATFPFPTFFDPGSAGVAVTFDDGNSVAKYDPSVYTPGHRRFERLFAGTGITEQRLAESNNVPLDAPDFLIWNMASRSEGTIFAVSKDPYIEPQVNFNYYSDGDLSDPASDISVNVAVLKSMKEFSLNLGSDMLLPPDEAFKSDAELDKWARIIWHTTNHYMCTTRMGTSPANSVCDSSARVWGTDNVYCGDVGIIPTMTSGHTSVPAFVIGRLVGKFLLEKFA